MTDKQSPAVERKSKPERRAPSTKAKTADSSVETALNAEAVELKAQEMVVILKGMSKAASFWSNTDDQKLFDQACAEIETAVNKNLAGETASFQGEALTKVLLRGGVEATFLRKILHQIYPALWKSIKRKNIGNYLDNPLRDRVSISEKQLEAANGRTSYVPPSRTGKKQLMTYVDEKVIKTLKGLALERDTTLQALLEEAVTDLLTKHEPSTSKVVGFLKDPIPR